MPKVKRRIRYERLALDEVELLPPRMEEGAQTSSSTRGETFASLEEPLSSGSGSEKQEGYAGVVDEGGFIAVVCGCKGLGRGTVDKNISL